MEVPRPPADPQLWQHQILNLLYHVGTSVSLFLNLICFASLRNAHSTNFKKIRPLLYPKTEMPPNHWEPFDHFFPRFLNCGCSNPFHLAFCTPSPAIHHLQINGRTKARRSWKGRESVSHFLSFYMLSWNALPSWDKMNDGRASFWLILMMK